MLNQNSLDAVADARYHQKFKRPLYDNYCFSRIPGTIRQVLTGAQAETLPDDALGHLKKNYQTVVLLFIDAFGWRFLEPLLQTHPFLKYFLEQGVVSQLTSQFPSTTAAHVTAMNTGLPVGEHGVYEWFYFEPKTDAVTCTLKFSYVTDKDRETLLQDGFTPEQLFSENLFYKDLKKSGVDTFIYLPSGYAKSSYGSIYCAGANLIPYTYFSEIGKNLESLLKAQTRKNYHYIYLDQFDSACHEYGPSSNYAQTKAKEILDFLEDLFLKKLRGKLKDCLLLATADHGQIEVHPEKTIFLDEKIPEITPLLKRNRRDELIICCGSPRDFFLHVKKEHLDKAREILANQLENDAEVLLVSDLMKEGFFGPKLSEIFLGRVGNLVILPFAEKTVWWNGDGIYKRIIEQDFGLHGGLSPEEMEIGFLACAME